MSRRLVIRLVIALAILNVLLWSYTGYSVPWTGLGEYNPSGQTQEGYQRARTLWDWLRLLVVPVVIAVGSFWFERAESVQRYLALPPAQITRF
jgi:hypothetical protein